MERVKSIFKNVKPIIGMVHLPPLPGSPQYGGEKLSVIAETTVTEAKKLEEAGFDGIMIENFGDVMFYKRVPPETVASMTYIAKEIKDNINIPIGICVLQSDAIAATAIAHAVEAEFIRVPYYTEVYVVDTGLMESCAAEVLRYRKFLGANVAIFADIHIKHGYPLAQRPIEESAEDAVYRGLADAIIVTGRKTGGPTNRDDIKRVKDVLPEWPVFVGSGVSVQNVKEMLSIADGAIVGTNLKVENKTTNPIDFAKAKEFMEIVNSIRKNN
ncbi:MAG: Membrane complex biogenesis protein, BtpA family [Caldanaerobacter subterraneus]|jgi:hypothetical protein|uniref:Membrane biogenesis protein n=1 Tax=Caldanaerobacter subterraneus TaxID=911092 RepID=A0A101E4L4_9THEO|nr:BtpA/SgcQ family protein [Caldanaerobacter subterraneus]KUK08464.1 MAG: Membrane complex biogenesis protein, BtpA family [Caldanaerobacter subterraneus]HBT48512.1 membrane biogenesis protein [Caldanaerobacter subterraneus]